MIINMTRGYLHDSRGGEIKLLPYADTENFSEFFFPDEFLPDEIIQDFYQAHIDLHDAWWMPNQEMMLHDQYGNETETRREILARQEDAAMAMIMMIKDNFAFAEYADGELRNEDGKIFGTKAFSVEGRACKWQRHLMLKMFDAREDYGKDQERFPEKIITWGRNCLVFKNPLRPSGRTVKVAVSVLTRKPVETQVAFSRPDWFYLYAEKKSAGATQERIL